MRPLDLAGRVLTRQISQAFFHEIPHHRIAFIRRALGCRNAEMQAQAGIGNDHVVEDVVRVTHPCDLFPSEVLRMAELCALRHRVRASSASQRESVWDGNDWKAR